MGGYRRNARWPNLDHCVCDQEGSDPADHRVGCRQTNSGIVLEGMGKRLIMAKAKMKAVVVPKFSSEAEEAAWWDRHRTQVEAEIRQRMRQNSPLSLGRVLQGETPTQPITLRIAKEDLETARRFAAERGLGYQTYIKMLLRNALAEERQSGDFRKKMSGQQRSLSKIAR